MDKGVPNCLDCGGKGLCDKHKLEYLTWVYTTARNELEAELKKQKETLTAIIAEQERIKQNELSSS